MPAIVPAYERPVPQGEATARIRMPGRSLRRRVKSGPVGTGP